MIILLFIYVFMYLWISLPHHECVVRTLLTGGRGGLLAEIAAGRKLKKVTPPAEPAGPGAVGAAVPKSILPTPLLFKGYLPSLSSLSVVYLARMKIRNAHVLCSPPQ